MDEKNFLVCSSCSLSAAAALVSTCMSICPLALKLNYIRCLPACPSAKIWSANLLKAGLPVCQPGKSFGTHLPSAKWSQFPREIGLVLSNNRAEGMSEILWGANRNHRHAYVNEYKKLGGWGTWGLLQLRLRLSGNCNTYLLFMPKCNEFIEINLCLG